MEQVDALLHGLGWERDLAIMQVVLPVGISFFTFQGMSYVIDIYRRKTAPATPARHGPADELLPASGRGPDRPRLAPDPAIQEACRS